MKPRHLIAIVGMMGSGKGTVVDYLLNRYGWPKVYFGGMVYDEVARRGLDIVKDEKSVREDMRKKEGLAVLAKRIAQKTEELFAGGQNVVVADGLCSWSEYQYLAAEFGPELVVIAVVVPKHLRYKRVTSRVDARRKYNLGDVKTRDVQEIENLEKGGPIAFADYYLLNDGSMEDLRSQADKLFSELGLDSSF